MLELVNPTAGPVLTQGVRMNKLSRGLQGDATYKISRLYAFQFQSRRIMKFSLFVPMFQTCDPRDGASFDPRGIL